MNPLALRNALAAVSVGGLYLALDSIFDDQGDIGNGVVTFFTLSVVIAIAGVVYIVSELLYKEKRDVSYWKAGIFALGPVLLVYGFDAVFLGGKREWTTFNAALGVGAAAAAISLS